MVKWMKWRMTSFRVKGEDLVLELGSWRKGGDGIEVSDGWGGKER